MVVNKIFTNVLLHYTSKILRSTQPLSYIAVCTTGNISTPFMLTISCNHYENKKSVWCNSNFLSLDNLMMMGYYFFTSFFTPNLETHESSIPPCYLSRCVIGSHILKFIHIQTYTYCNQLMLILMLIKIVLVHKPHRKRF